MTRYHQFLSTLIFLPVFLCSVMQAAISAPQWQSPLFLDHPLLGKIWDAGKEDWITKDQFSLELQQYHYVLLGEKHDNPDHHRLQAEVIDGLVDAGKNPSVVMEMLALNSWQDQPMNWSNLDQLQHMANKLNSGWSWELYTPILDAVVRHKLKLFAGNIESEELHASAVGGDTALDLYKEFKIDSAALKALEQNIVESHCGYANSDLIQFMTTAQLQRDHVLTTSLLRHEKPVVLIAGAGHVRNDYAIAAQLLHKHRILSFISIAFIEVQEGMQNPEDYLPNNNEGKLNKVFDILYFTASNTKEDPCVKFRKQLKNMQHRQTPNSE